MRSKILINSAGLHAHDISIMAGGPPYDIEFIRGDYYELMGGVERWGIRTLIYPAMPPGSRSKGVHLGSPDRRPLVHWAKRDTGGRSRTEGDVFAGGQEVPAGHSGK